ncbi:hypothetical protein ACFVFQ_06170 [Streptomyces sp. NPDC057743]|uniref:hypothetical protein n=1 Tax=Streptomyces sp. NPDC057743 TaxID=3346236 RepID=UPI00368E4890
MALQPFWAALVDAPSLTANQQMAIANVVAVRGAPATAARFFSRPDTTNDVRNALIERAHDRQVLKAILATPAVATEHLLAVAEKLGAEKVLLEVARTRWDLPEAQLLLIQQLDHSAARRVAEEWQFFGQDVRIALIDAAIRDQPPQPDEDALSDSRQEAEYDAWRAKVQSWHDDIWALLSAEPAQSLWPELVAREPDDEGRRMVTNMLLNRAKNLNDRMLLACLRTAYPDPAPEADDDWAEWGAGLELARLAKVTARHPRALLLHGAILRTRTATAGAAVITHVRKEGIYSASWSTFESLAAACVTPDLLRDAAECLSEATMPSWYGNRRPDADWITARSKAADAFANNPLCPVDALVTLAPLLGPATAARFVEHPDLSVREAAEQAVSVVAERVAPPKPRPAGRKQPARPTVPSDDELSGHTDPRSELAGFLPLKGPAAYKREVAQAILGSRFADADLLRELPAPLTLPSASHASAIAGLLQAELGDDAHAWHAFGREVTRLPSNATKTLGALLEEVRSSSTSLHARRGG